MSDKVISDTEDGNELKIILANAFDDFGHEVVDNVGVENSRYELPKTYIDNLELYIQSNYILKSDVDSIENGYIRLIEKLKATIKEISK